MTKRSVTHGIFTIERRFDASPRRVFQAFADPEAKARWFGGPPEWGPNKKTMDFRVGGRETNRATPPGHKEHSFEALYYEIIPDERVEILDGNSEPKFGDAPDGRIDVMAVITKALTSAGLMKPPR